jgi:hypothetical protein
VEKQVRVSLRLADGGGTPTSPEQLDYELAFDVAIAMRLRRALRGKMPEGNYESHSQPAFIAVFHAAGFSRHCYEMSENMELRRNRYALGHARC